MTTMAAEHSRPTLKDVAQRAGVSIATASRAMADNPAVATTTRTRIQALAAEMGYLPNAQARALQSSRSNTIGIVVPSLLNPYFATMVTAVQNAAKGAGLATIITSTDENPETMAASLTFLASHGVDGIICVPDEHCAEQLNHLHDQGIPLVLIDRELTGSPIPTVISDPQPGMDAAVSLLVEHHALPIGYLSGPMSTSTGRARLEAFQQACRNHDLEPQLVFHGGFEQEQGFEGATHLLDHGARTLFAGDTMMTIGVLEACHRAGLSIGEDISVIGFDSHPLFTLQPRPLTVIDQQVDSMARQAFTVLHGLLAGTEPIQPTRTDLVTPTILIQGDSLMKGSHP